MNETKVLRYEPSTWGRSSPLMVKVSDGEWVRYSDYQALAATLASSEKHRYRAEALVDDLVAKVEDWKRAYAQQEKHYQREVERLEKAWDEWKVIADEKQDENDRLRGKVERLEADPLNSIGDAIRDTAVLDRVRAERDALTLAVDDWQAAAKSIAEERDALTERVRELEGQVKDARWAEARMSKQCDYETAEITRLREALEGYECACEWESAEGVNPTKVHTCPRCAALEEPNPS